MYPVNVAACALPICGEPWYHPRNISTHAKKGETTCTYPR